MKAMIYNGVCGLKASAYIKDDKENYRIISEFIKPFFRDYLKTSEVKKARKTKVLLLELCMEFRMPKALVENLYKISTKTLFFSK